MFDSLAYLLHHANKCQLVKHFLSSKLVKLDCYILLNVADDNKHSISFLCSASDV